MPTGLEDLDLRVYIDYPQERQNRKGPFVFATDGTQVDAGTKNNCLIDPVTLSVFGLPLPMTNDWKTNFSGNYARYQKSDFTFTSAGGSNDWLDIDYYGNGDTYIISASSVAARQSAAIQLNGGVERNEPLFFSFSKLQKKNSDSQNLIKLFWSDTTNSDKDVQLHFNSDGSCTVFRGYTPLTGSIIANTVSSTITGVGTKFQSELSGGQTLCDVYGRVIGTIASITNDLSLTLGANAAYDFVGSYNNKTPLKVQSYSRTESNYSQGRPISTIANPNDQFNDVYIIPMRGRDLLVLTSFGLNFCHTFSDLNVPDPPANIRNYVNADPMTSSINGTSVPIILPKGAFMQKMTTLDLLPGRRGHNTRVQIINQEPSRAKQAPKKDTQIRNILIRYAKTGVLGDPSRRPIFGDFTNTEQFETSLNLVANVRSQFAQLSSEIRNRFQNDPVELLTFLNDPKNNIEAVKLGLKDKSALPKPPKEPDTRPQSLQPEEPKK